MTFKVHRVFIKVFVLYLEHPLGTKALQRVQEMRVHIEPGKRFCFVARQ